MITGNNYEEFFLLYVDNELSPAERHAVERFVDAHPDLQEEWEMLLQCRIAPDDRLVFGEKDALLRPGAALPGDAGKFPTGNAVGTIAAGGAIHAGNYEEYFLSYIDGELAPAARTQVEEYVRLHPALLPEFTLLQQATYTPGPAIVCPHKERLYRTERDRKIILLPWGRIAAAAIAVGAIVLLIFKSGQDGRPPSGPAHPERALAGHNGQGNNKKENKHVTPVPTDTLYATKGGERQEGGSALSGSRVKASRDPHPGTRGTDQGSLAQADRGRAIGNMLRGVTGDRPTDGSPDPDPAGKHDPVKKFSDLAGSRLAVLDPAATQRPATIATRTELTLAGNRGAGVNKNSSFATQALLADNMEETEDGLPNSFASEPVSPKKNKLRGFFRKVSRVLEKTTSQDEDDKHNVLIGGFQFALK